MKTSSVLRSARRMQNVHGEAAYVMLARARELERQGRSIIHMEIGEPDFDTPPPVVAAGIEALRRGETHYTGSQGTPDLREAIARDLTGTYGVDIDPAAVIVSPGAKMSIFSTIMALIDPGDEVIYPNPAYPAYEADIHCAEATAVAVRLEESNDFRLSLDDVERRITPRTRMIVINSPQNPTGGVLTKSDLERLGDIARRHDLLVLSDEIYSEIYYGERPASMLNVPNILDRLILINGFSKTFAMTGWRLGYAIVPRDLVSVITLFVNTSVSCTAAFTQSAAIQAFTDKTRESVDRMVEEFRKRRDVFVDGLNSIKGFRCLRPTGAFYLFPNITGTGLSSQELCERLLNDTGIACLPGTAFGEYGEGYIRFSFANSLSNIDTAIEQIRKFVSTM